MTSARGSAKAQAVGRIQPSAARSQRVNDRQLANLQRQAAGRADLLARFRARTAPPGNKAKDPGDDGT